MKHLIALLIALHAGLDGGIARADNIIWLNSEFPPMAMSQGPHANQGYINELATYLAGRLPQHQFGEQVVPWQRAMHMAEKGGPYCLLAAFQTPERETYLRFSKPYGYVFPLGLVTRRAQREAFTKYLNADGKIQLGRLLRDRNLRPGIANQRSYGNLIDNLLKRANHSQAAPISQIYQSESTSGLFSMLDYQRIDYTFSYPGELVYFSSRHQDLQFYLIEGNDRLLPGRLSCTRSPQTDRAFTDLSEALKSNHHQELLRNSYERWLPEDLIEPYQRMLEELARE